MQRRLKPTQFLPLGTSPKDEDQDLIFNAPPEPPVQTSLLNYGSFFEMGQTARGKLEAAKEAQRRHRFNPYQPQLNEYRPPASKKFVPQKSPQANSSKQAAAQPSSNLNLDLDALLNPLKKGNGGQATQVSFRSSTLDTLERQQHQLRSKRDLLAKQIKHGSDRIQLINREDLATRVQDNYEDLKHRRISSLVAPEVDNQSSFRLRQFGQVQERQSSLSRPYLNDIENQAMMLNFVDVTANDLNPKYDQLHQKSGQRRHSINLAAHGNAQSGTGHSRDQAKVLPVILSERGHRSSTEVPTPNRSRLGSGRSGLGTTMTKLYLDQDYESELGKAMHQLGTRSKQGKDFEFQRLQSIALKSVDKQPLSNKHYKPYLPKKIQNGHQDKIKNYMDKLQSGKGQLTSKLSMTSPIKIIKPKEVPPPAKKMSLQQVDNIQNYLKESAMKPSARLPSMKPVFESLKTISKDAITRHENGPSDEPHRLSIHRHSALGSHIPTVMSPNGPTSTKIFHKMQQDPHIPHYGNQKRAIQPVLKEPKQIRSALKFSLTKSKDPKDISVDIDEKQKMNLSTIKGFAGGRTVSFDPDV